MLKFLLHEGEQLDPASEHGITAFHLACQHDRVQMVQFLINNLGFSSITHQTASQFQPIHIAARFGATRVMQFLVSTFSIDVASFSSNLDPLKIALKCNQQHTADYLVRLKKFDLAKKVTSSNLNYFGYAVVH